MTSVTVPFLTLSWYNVIMTATQTQEFRLQLAKDQFKILKTPALRREIRLLEDELKERDTSKLMFQHVNTRSKRRRGVRIARLHG